jgi:hypothetical protein
MEGLGFELKREASLKTLTNDVVTSSAIEGERLDAQEVRSSIARRLLIVAGVGKTLSVGRVCLIHFLLQELFQPHHQSKYLEKFLPHLHPELVFRI